MATLVIPRSIDPLGQTEVFEPLRDMLATAKPGDVVQAPVEHAVYRCDKTPNLSIPGVRYNFDGATIKHTTARPYVGNLEIFDGVITGGNRLTTAKLLPPAVNYGYVQGPGIKPGTQIKLDPSRKAGTLSNTDCTNATGLHIIFTSKDDRSRSGFNADAPDCELHDVTIESVNPTGAFKWDLEAQHGVNFTSRAVGWLLDGVTSRYTHGDGRYFGSSGVGKGCAHITETNGGIVKAGRSAVSLANCSDINLAKYWRMSCNRTTFNMEPQNAVDVVDRVRLFWSYVYEHGLSFVSSGGNRQAKVGAVDIVGNFLHNTHMQMLLKVGDNAHLRGPYRVTDNYSDDTVGFGTGSGALIEVAFARGLIGQRNHDTLQARRSPQMAGFRTHQMGPGAISIVSDNDFVGGPELIAA